MIAIEFVSVTRRIRSSPRFAGAIVLSVALAVGPILVASSAFESVFLRGPALRPDIGTVGIIRAAMATRGNASISRAVSFPDYEDIRGALPVNSWRLMAAWTIVDVSGTLPSGERPLRLAAVTGDYFSIADARFRQGYPPGEGEPGVVVRKALMDELAGDQASGYVTVYGQQLPIVGVVDDAFRGVYPNEGVDVWAPLGMLPSLERDPNLLTYRELGNLTVLVTMARGAAAQSLGPALDVVSTNLVEFHEENSGWHLQLAGAKRTFSAVLRTTEGQGALGAVLVLLCVLAIAATNIANLFAIRTEARAAEARIRLALGLSRARLILYECLEPATLSAIGFLLGLGLGTVTLRQLAGVEFLDRLDLQVTMPAVLAATAAALLFAGACALLAAQSLARVSASDVSRTGPAVAAPGATKAQRALLVVQFTLAVGFSHMATLWSVAVRAQLDVDPGFDTNTLLVVRRVQGTADRTPAEWGSDYDRVVDAVTAVPGVVAVSGAVSEFFSGYQPAYRPITARPAVDVTQDGEIQAGMDVVGNRYFATLGVHLLAGREFGTEERFGEATNVVVNATLARMLATDGQAVGMTIYEYGKYARRIVGVAPDIRVTVADTVRPMLYRSLTESPMPAFILYVRVAQPSPEIALAIRSAIVGQIPQSGGRMVLYTSEEQRRQRDLPALAVLSLSLGLAILTILVAGLGLYSVGSFSIATRQREFGVRAALGASRARLASMVLIEGLRWTSAAMLLSLPAIWIGEQVVGKLVIGARPVSALVVVAGVGAYLLVVFIALIVPARRGASLNPAEAIRST